MADQEEQARQEAEARRQKILEGANQRMDFVMGLQPADKAENTTGEATSQDAVTTENATASDEGAPAAAPAKSSASAKMAAMRRRRFKKGGATVKKEEETTSSDAATTTPTTDEIKVGETTVSPTTITPTDQEVPKTETVVADTERDLATATEESPPSSEPTPAANEPVPAATETAPAKKYMGVAKMRRKMSKEKQAAAAAAAVESTEESTSEPSHAGASNGSAEASAEVAESAPSKKSAASRSLSMAVIVPIVMHVLTVILLFVAGLDVGLQQQNIRYGTGLMVHKQLVPQQRLQILQSSSPGALLEREIKREPLEVEEPIEVNSEVWTEDEFENVDDLLNKESSETENIDPLFQVDLDKLTRGDGLFMMLGRFAVACHRVNLAVLYYLPLNIANWVSSFMTSGMSNGDPSSTSYPPVLCLVALLIRQVVGKLILGAGLPEKADESQMDVVSMAKNFIMSFLSKAFPTAANLYDTWTTLRFDMYVVMCGLFVGLAFHHHQPNGSVLDYVSADGSLATDAGLTDEL